MKTSEAIDQIATALAVAQSKMKPAIKDSSNPAFGTKAKYADLTSVWEACREALTANGISAIQDVARPNGHVEVTTRLLHKSGQWLEFGPLSMPIDKPNAHGVGSATSYARRYALSAAVGVVQDDDDGNAASGVGAPDKPADAPAMKNKLAAVTSGAKVPDPKPEPPAQLSEAALKEAAKMIRKELDKAPDMATVEEIKTHHATTLTAIKASSPKLHAWTLESATAMEAA
jgi:hypothetical protein